MTPARLVASTWQCPECQAYWEPDAPSAAARRVEDVRWRCLGRPREKAHTRVIEAHIEGSSALPTPTVTPRMVQLVLDTYADHMSVTPNDGAAPLGWCGECETGIYEPRTIQAHAQEKAAAALQDALDKAGWDATE